MSGNTGSTNNAAARELRDLQSAVAECERSRAAYLQQIDQKDRELSRLNGQIIDMKFAIQGMRNNANRRGSRYGGYKSRKNRKTRKQRKN